MSASERAGRFVRDGFVRVDGAFSREQAEAARALLWRDSGCDPDDRTSWKRPVVRLGWYSQPPFITAAQAPALRQAFDELAGAGRWAAPAGLGTFVIRFPSAADPGDAGWHVDASFGQEGEPDFLAWRVNLRSRGRRLLMLFLFSDVGADDAPTRLRVGSHSDVARQLAPAGEAGLSLRQLMARDFGGSSAREVALAMGDAGTVYLCHPFLVHAAQPHRGTRPRFLAQPPLLPRDDSAASPDNSPVGLAIRRAIA